MHLTNWLSCASRTKLHLKQHLFRVPIFNSILSIFYISFNTSKIPASSASS